MLFDVEADPGETKDLAAELPGEVTKLRTAHEAWFADVSSTRGFAPQRISLGSDEENPTTLTRQDWRGPQAGWTPKSVGHWEVEVEQHGSYALTVRYDAVPAEAQVRVAFAGKQFEQMVPAGSQQCTFDGVSIRPGAAKLEVTIEHSKGVVGATYVDVLRK